MSTASSAAPHAGTAPDVPVAVCVPAHASAPGLRVLLESLGGVDYPRELLQVIVAIDGANADLEQVARAYADDVVVLPVNRGSYAARNRAIERVRDAAVVLFTDSDCVVDPGWIRAHLAGLAAAELSGGPVRITLRSAPSPAEWLDSQHGLRQDHFIQQVGFAATANLGVRREVLDRIAFAEDLRSGGDFEFGHRARSAGYRLVYTSAAVIEHPARTTARSVLKKCWRVSGGARDLATRGHSALDRRDSSRQRAAAAARAADLRVSRWWLLRLTLLDYTCSAVYAARVPSVIAPKLRRLLLRRS